MKTLAASAFGAGLGLLALALPATAQDQLTIGTEAAYPPFAYVLPSGEMTGFDIDMANALCAEMGSTCEIVNQAFDGLIPALNANRIDAIIASMAITPEREQAIDFAGPYYLSTALFVGPADADIAFPEGLDSLTVGVQRGTTMANYMEKFHPDARVQFYDTIEAANLDLGSGRIDVVFADSAVMDGFLKSADGAAFAAISDPVSDLETLGPGAGIGVRKGDAELEARFDEALAAIIESGEYATINAKYLDFSVQP